MLILVKYKVNCGRMGFIDGLFACEKEDLQKLTDRMIFFGEVLGKHSDVKVKFKLSDFKILTDDQLFICRLVDYVGKESIAGYNPFNYLNEEQ